MWSDFFLVPVVVMVTMVCSVFAYVIKDSDIVMETPASGSEGISVQSRIKEGDLSISSSIRVKRQSGDGKLFPSSSHQLPCNKGEKQKAACIQGVCYALDMGGHRSAFCQCPEKYEGRRCELLSSDFYLVHNAEMKRAGILGGVIFGIVVVIVCISIYCSCRKGKRKRKRKRKRTHSKRIPSILESQTKEIEVTSEKDEKEEKKENEEKRRRKGRERKRKRKRQMKSDKTSSLAEIV